MVDLTNFATDVSVDDVINLLAVICSAYRIDRETILDSLAIALPEPSAFGLNELYASGNGEGGNISMIYDVTIGLIQPNLTTADRIKKLKLVKEQMEKRLYEEKYRIEDEEQQLNLADCPFLGDNMFTLQEYDSMQPGAQIADGTMINGTGSGTDTTPILPNVPKGVSFNWYAKKTPMGWNIHLNGDKDNIVRHMVMVKKLVPCTDDVLTFYSYN